jgi:hypothetical protein
LRRKFQGVLPAIPRPEYIESRRSVNACPRSNDGLVLDSVSTLVFGRPQQSLYC